MEARPAARPTSLASNSIRVYYQYLGVGGPFFESFGNVKFKDICGPYVVVSLYGLEILAFGVLGFRA